MRKLRIWEEFLRRKQYSLKPFREPQTGQGGEEMLAPEPRSVLLEGEEGGLRAAFQELVKEGRRRGLTGGAGQVLPAFTTIRHHFYTSNPLDLSKVHVMIHKGESVKGCGWISIRIHYRH